MTGNARAGSGGAAARTAGGATPGEIELRRPAPWGSEPPTDSDWLAAEASPKLLDSRYRDLKDAFERTGGIGMEPGTTIAENSFIYDLQDHALQTREGAIRSKWWGVAGDVTGLLGVGAADPNVPAAFKEPTKAFLQTTSHSLASMNFENFERLAQGQEIPDLEGLRGKKLDYALVEKEQKAVTAIMGQYFEGKTAEERAEIIKEINSRMNAEGRGFSLAVDVISFVTDGTVPEVVGDLFPNGSCDFANEAHRIALGKAMIDLWYGKSAEDGP